MASSTVFAKLDQTYHLDTENRDIFYSYYKELNLPIFGANSIVRRNASISRGQFAQLYAAVNGLDLSEIQAVQYLYMNELTTGTTGKRTYADYKASRNLTRGELAAFMYRINQQGKIAIEGLASAPAGNDNNKITLPANFGGEPNDGTVIIPTVPGENTDDKTSSPETNGSVKRVDIANEELIANGVDSSLISIELRDSYGNEIPYDESLQFRVTSQAGAKISTSSEGNRENTVTTDGPDLNVFVTAPALTNTVVDTIRFEMVNPSDKYYTYRNQPIEVSIRYVPKPELRISYELFGPGQPELKRDTAVSVVRPLPALPEGVLELGNNNNETSEIAAVTEAQIVDRAAIFEDSTMNELAQRNVPFTPNGIITVQNLNTSVKRMSGYKWEAYTHPVIGKEEAPAYSKDIQYGNADLKLEGQTISVWLFEQILQSIVAERNVNVMYTVNNESRATYDLQKVIDMGMQQAPFVYLTDRILPSAEQITLAHEESVNVIEAMYGRLGKMI